MTAITNEVDTYDVPGSQSATVEPSQARDVSGSDTFSVTGRAKRFWDYVDAMEDTNTDSFKGLL